MQFDKNVYRYNTENTINFHPTIFLLFIREFESRTRSGQSPKNCAFQRGKSKNSIFYVSQHSETPLKRGIMFGNILIRAKSIQIFMNLLKIIFSNSALGQIEQRTGNKKPADDFRTQEYSINVFILCRFPECTSQSIKWNVDLIEIYFCHHYNDNNNKSVCWRAIEWQILRKHKKRFGSDMQRWCKASAAVSSEHFNHISIVVMTVSMQFRWFIETSVWPDSVPLVYISLRIRAQVGFRSNHKNQWSRKTLTNEKKMVKWRWNNLISYYFKFANGNYKIFSISVRLRINLFQHCVHFIVLRCNAFFGVLCRVSVCTTQILCNNKQAKRLRCTTKRQGEEFIQNDRSVQLDRRWWKHEIMNA